MKFAERSVPVYPGSLMSMSEVCSARYQHGTVLTDKFQQSWYLCGDVSEEFFRRLTSKEEITHCVSAFRIDGNTTFIVFALQICEHQARFLLPLASEKSIRFVDEVERTSICMALRRAGANTTFLLEFVDKAGQLRDIRKMWKKSARLPFDVDVGVLKMACYSTTQATSVPSGLAEVVVSKVCLSVVLND